MPLVFSYWTQLLYLVFPLDFTFWVSAWSYYYRHMDVYWIHIHKHTHIYITCIFIYLYFIFLWNYLCTHVLFTLRPMLPCNKRRCQSPTKISTCHFNFIISFSGMIQQCLTQQICVEHFLWDRYSKSYKDNT